MKQTPIALVAFDLDGTIVDDGWAHGRANDAAAAELAVSLWAPGAMTGYSLRDSWSQMCAQAGVCVDLEELATAHFQRTYDLLAQEGTPAAPGLAQTMAQLKQAGKTVAVTSSSDEWFVKAVVRLLGLADYVDFYVTRNQVEREKPEPDIYLLAQRMAGVSPENAIGVEDSVPGCQAVQRAGMRCVGFLNQGKNRQDLHAADFQIQTMPEMLGLLSSLE